MSNLFKKIFVSFAVLSVVVWSSGATALATQSNDEEGVEKVTICHHTDSGLEEISVADSADVTKHLEEHGDSIGACPPPPPVEVVHGEWCSALLGIMESTMDNNQVIDLSSDPSLSDVSVMATWYANGDNTACRARFNGTFDQTNYQNIDWCAGLLQGVQDTYGSHVGDTKYSEIFNLVDNVDGNDVGAINLSDHSEAVRLAAAGDQVACYAYYVPPMPAWPVESMCGNSHIDEGEECDGGEPAACVTENGYTGLKTCKMPPTETVKMKTSVEPLYCVFNPCVSTQRCGDEVRNGNETCDDGNTVSGDGCNASCQIEIPEPVATRSQWCSALKGIYQSEMDNNKVIDLNNNIEDTDGDDELMSTWYTSHNDTACYGRFDLGETLNFDKNNYQNIDWCAGLKQGVMDYIGTSTTTAEFSTIFDLNHDGKINLSDTPVLAGLLAVGNQATCYTYYNFPAWPEEPQVCQEVAHAATYNPYPTCGPATCESGYSVSEGACVENSRPSGGGGGGGGGSYSAFNIFNVQNILTGSSANITWETNRQSLTWMLYGTSTSYGSEYQGANYHIGHTLALDNLLPNTTYHYQIRAKDASNNTVYDIDRTFNTAGVLPQVLGVKENACKPDVDGDIKGVMNFIAGSLVRGCGPEVYHVLGGNVYHIPNWQYLHDNYFAQRIYNVTDEVIAQYGEISQDDKTIVGNGLKVLGSKLYSDGTLLKAKNGKIYVIMNGHKVHVVSLEDLKKYAGNKMYNVSDAVLNQY